MKKKMLLGMVTTSLLVIALISNYAIAGGVSSSTDPNVVALNNARIGSCWLHTVSNKDYCLHIQSNMGCAPCDDAPPVGPPPPVEPPTVLPSN